MKWSLGSQVASVTMSSTTSWASSQAFTWWVANARLVFSTSNPSITVPSLRFIRKICVLLFSFSAVSTGYFFWWVMAWKSMLTGGITSTA